MGLTMHQRHAIMREMCFRFQRSSKKERSILLNQCVELTGYNRTYAAYVLRNCGRKQLRMIAGRRVVFVPAQARPQGSKRQRKGFFHTKAFVSALRQFWALSDGLCGKRLAIFIREVVPLLEQQGTLKSLGETVRGQLLTVSAATIDRLLKETKRQSILKGRSGTRPGTLLKHHIAVRTFADWDDAEPGFCEIDMVAHDGGSSFGDYCHTLTLTDVTTTWTETEPVQNKAQTRVFTALKNVRTRLPFPLLGLDSDNGGEFINSELVRYCADEAITFTRSRPYRKNDNCFVEQKNYSIVRRTVGYYRYDTAQQLRLLHALYSRLRLYTNFFQPVMKLKDKVRHGSKVTRHYDIPQTPYARVLAHPNIDQRVKDALTAQYLTLNVVSLKRELNSLQRRLFRAAIHAGPPPQPPSGIPYPAPNHPWRVSTLSSRATVAKLTVHLQHAHTKHNTIDIETKNHHSSPKQSPPPPKNHE